MSTSGWIGKTLAGRYQIEVLISQGGISSVFVARDPNRKRAIAGKMIHLNSGYCVELPAE